MPVPESVKQHFKSALSTRSKRWSQSLNPSTVSSPVYIPPPHCSGSNLAAAFSRLPFEICVEIFSHCPTDFPRIDSQVPPLTLALVCKTWYYLVTTTPRLWSCFELVLEGSGSSQSERNEIKRRLLLWLRRSRHHPLSFRIIHEYAGSAPDMRSAELLDILLPHAPRWQNVHFHGPGDSLTHLPHEFHWESLPTLRSISFQLTKSWSNVFDLSRLNIPWSQLSGLDLQLYRDNIHSLDECFGILSAAKNLTSCTLNASCVFTLPKSTEELALPYLRSLRLIIEGAEPAAVAETNILNFLESLSLSGLRAFSLEWLVSRTQGDTGLQWQTVHPRFANFLHSSAGSLEDLGLAYLPLRDYEIIRYLDGLSGLRNLDLKFTLASHQPDPITDDLLEHLTLASPLTALQRARRRAGPTVDCLPLLKALKLQCSGEYLNQAMLLSLVESRQLQTFEVLTVKSLSKEFRDMVTRKGPGFNFSASTLNIR